MLPDNGIWRYTVSLLDSYDDELANEWAHCKGKNASYITIIVHSTLRIRSQYAGEIISENTALFLRLDFPCALIRQEKGASWRNVNDKSA